MIRLHMIRLGYLKWCFHGLLFGMGSIIYVVSATSFAISLLLLSVGIFFVGNAFDSMFKSLGAVLVAKPHSIGRGFTS